MRSGGRGAQLIKRPNPPFIKQMTVTARGTFETPQNLQNPKNHENHENLENLENLEKPETLYH